MQLGHQVGMFIFHRELSKLVHKLATNWLPWPTACELHLRKSCHNSVSLPATGFSARGEWRGQITQAGRRAGSPDRHSVDGLPLGKGERERKLLSATAGSLTAGRNAVHWPFIFWGRWVCDHNTMLKANGQEDTDEAQTVSLISWR